MVARAVIEERVDTSGGVITSAVVVEERLEASRGIAQAFGRVELEERIRPFSGVGASVTAVGCGTNRLGRWQKIEADKRERNEKETGSSDGGKN